MDAPADAYALFARARTAVTAARYPDAVEYTISIAGLDGATPRANHYRAFSRPGEGVIDVSSISREEAAAPPRAIHGFNFALSAFVCGGRCETGSATVALPVGRPAASPDLIGVPLLDPTYAFGLRYTLPHTSRTPAEATELPVIAVVATKARDYAVTLVDTPEIDGTPTYHLRLTPLRKPHDNRLRELWIGEGDFLPRKAVLAGDFTIAPLVDVPWVVDFSIRSGAPYIRDESAQAVLYLQHRRVVRNAVVSFEDVREAGASIVGRPVVTPEAIDGTLIEP